MKKLSSNRIVFDLNFVEDAYNEMEDYMKQKENLMRFLLVAARRFSHTQEAAIQLAYIRLLDNAEGQFLTDLAERLGIVRHDQSDTHLQAYIKFRALSQASEGTRSDIVNLLKIVSGGDYVKIYKGGNNNVDITFASECLDINVMTRELEGLFPINTNLVATSIITGKKPIGFGWETGGATIPAPSGKIGVLGWDDLRITSETGYVSTIIVQSE